MTDECCPLHDLTNQCRRQDFCCLDCPVFRNWEAL